MPQEGKAWVAQFSMFLQGEGLGTGTPGSEGGGSWEHDLGPTRELTFVLAQGLT